jgi:hypothetical protein
LQGLQADLAAIGIEVEVIPGTWSDWREPIRNGEVQMGLYTWSASFPDAYDFVSGWMTCASVETGFNDGGYCNERIDELVAAAEALPQTDPERIAAYREIEELAVNTDVGMIGIGNEKAVALGRENVHDDPLNGLIGRLALPRVGLDRAGVRRETDHVRREASSASRDPHAGVEPAVDQVYDQVGHPIKSEPNRTLPMIIGTSNRCAA